MRIFKTLPTGKRKRVDVTIDEYYNDGWATNGWADDTLEGISYIDQALQINTFKRKFDKIPTQELAKYPLTIHIFRDTPRGRERRQITYGQYMEENWPSNGWIIDTQGVRWNEPKIGPNTRRAIELQLHQQNWWWPKRSYDQARAMQKWAFSDDSYTDEQKRQQIELLRDMNYVPNPKMESYSKRLHAYAGKKTNQIRKLKYMPDWAKRSWWRQQKQLLEMEQNVVPPDPIITKERERRESYPRPTRSLGGRIDAFKIMEHNRHYNTYSFPWRWRKWRGF